MRFLLCAAIGFALGHVAAWSVVPEGGIVLSEIEAIEMRDALARAEFRIRNCDKFVGAWANVANGLVDKKQRYYCVIPQTKRGDK